MKLPPIDLLNDIAAKVPEETYINVATPSYLHKNPLIRWLILKRLTILERWIDDYADSSSTHMMDFGCGIGILLPSMSQKAEIVYGVDIRLLPAQMSIEYYQLQNIRLLLPESAERVIPDQTIKIIVCGEVLEHIAHLNKLLDFFKKVMTADAHLLVSLPTENVVYQIGRRIAGFTGDYHIHDAQAIHQKIIDAGFYPTRMESIPFGGPLALYQLFDYMLSPPTTNSRFLVKELGK